MNIPLSKRLQACAGFVNRGDRVADIGCDHGYLSIYLLHHHIASFVFAADINEMPLASAKRNAEKFGIQNNLRFFLSNGLENVEKDFDVMICAGMGADTMISILSAASWLKSGKYRLILQCQSKTPSLRQFLTEEGWHIHRESVLRDGRFLYTVMEVLWRPEEPRLTPGQLYFPPALMHQITPELVEYYHDVLFRLKRAAKGQGANASPQLLAAICELESATAFNELKEDQNDNS